MALREVLSVFFVAGLCSGQFAVHPEFPPDFQPPPPQEHFVPPPPQSEQNVSYPYPPPYPGPYFAPQPVYHPGTPVPYPQPYPPPQYNGNFSAPPPYYPAYYPPPPPYPTVAPPLPPGFNTTSPAYPYPAYPAPVFYPPPYAPVPYAAPYPPPPYPGYPGVPVYYGPPVPSGPQPQQQGQVQVPDQPQPQPPNKQHYRVLGIPSGSFLQVVSSNSTVVAYSGFIIELLDALSNVLDFSYSINVQPDRLYGSQTADGSWNGLIRSVIEGKCDFAAADLSVTAAREAVLDFTLPFYQYSMQMVVNKQYPPNGNGYTYVVRNNADASYIKQSTNPRDRTIWESLTKNFPTSFVESEKEGIEKVLSGPFAFIMESPGAQSAVASNGHLEISSESFPSSYYAFAVPTGSLLREKFSWGIATLQENGQLHRMVKKYLSSP